MTAEALALIAAFFVCSEATDHHLLNQDEIRDCNVIFETIKANFAGVDVDDFPGMTAAERLTANQSGYQAYLDWKDENPELVLAMQEEARQVLLGQTGSSL